MDSREVYECICREVGIDPGSSANGHCPAHRDDTGSLSVKYDAKSGRVLIHCFAGCQTKDIVKELGFEMSQLFPEDKTRRPTRAKKQPREKADITVERLAAAKKIPVEFLLKLGLRTVEDEYWGRFVEIPYCGTTGARLPVTRRRLGLRGNQSNWGKGDKPALYGLQYLGRIRELGWVVLVEGESDCWTLWLHKFPALGVPGARNLGALRAEYFEELRQVYVFREPDKGGAAFAAEVPRRLRELGYEGEIAEIWIEGHKDPNELHKSVNDEEFKRIFQSVLDKKKAVNVEVTREAAPPPAGRALTDLGNAERLVERFGKDVRHCREWNKWLVWDGVRWVIDREGRVERMAAETARGIYAEALACRDYDLRKKVVEHAVRSESERAINAMVSLARSQPGVPILPERLDADPWLMAVANGTVDLRTGELRESKREDHITKQAAVKYEAGAECPEFEKFLRKILLDNENLRGFIQRAIGYSLTGRITERCIFILHGVGRNGKSTLLEVIQAMLGDYSLRTPTETLMVKYRGSDIPNDIARLKGARFVSASESEEGQRLAEAKIKDLTGGDTVSARFMRGEFFDFKPEFKLWLGTNHKPVIRGTDNAIWDRIRLVPFEYRVPEDEINPLLPERLRGEMDGIFQWALRGCLEWQAHGLINPDEVKAAMGEYRTEMDVLASFLEDSCEMEPYLEISSKDLYAEYRKWCELNAEKMLSQKKFGMRLMERGIESKRSMKMRYWAGIGLRDEHDTLMSHDASDASSQVIPYARAREKTPKPASYASSQSDASSQGTVIPNLSAYD